MEKKIKVGMIYHCMKSIEYDILEEVKNENNNTKIKILFFFSDYKKAK